MPEIIEVPSFPLIMDRVYELIRKATPRGGITLLELLHQYHYHYHPGYCAVLNLDTVQLVKSAVRELRWGTRKVGTDVKVSRNPYYRLKAVV